MNPGIEHLVKAVIASLESEVLPHLDAQDKPASNVRACLMLLANIESRIALEPQCLYDDNRELRELLRAAVDDATALGIDAQSREAMLLALDRHPQPEMFYDPALAVQANRDYQELLTRIINEFPARHGNAGQFRAKLHRYLAESGKREMILAEKALGRVPI